MKLFADTSADWIEFTKIWGPAIPMFFVFVVYLHRLIFVTVPMGFKTLRRAIDEAKTTAKEQHDEAMYKMDRLETILRELPLCIHRGGKRRQTREGP